MLAEELFDVEDKYTHEIYSTKIEPTINKEERSIVIQKGLIHGRH